MTARPFVTDKARIQTIEDVNRVFKRVQNLWPATITIVPTSHTWDGIQAAVDQVMAVGGGEVALEAATYTGTGTITLGDNVALVGRGASTILSGTMAITTDPVLFATGADNITIRDLVVSGTHSWSVFLTGGSGHRILRNSFSGGTSLDTGSRGGGIYLENLSDSEIADNDLFGNGAAGQSDIKYADIQANSGTYNLTRCRITGNRCRSTLVQMNIAVFDPYRCRIQDNIVTGAYTPSVLVRGGYGIMVYNTGTAGTTPVEALITGNLVHDVEGTGIYVQGIADSVVTENTVQDVCDVQTDGSLSVAGIAIDDISLRSVCANNKVIGSAQYGIQVTLAHKTVVTGNEIETTTKDGISIRGITTDVAVVGNVVTATTGDAIGSYSDEAATRILIANNLIRGLTNNGTSRGIFQAATAANWVVSGNLLSDTNSRGFDLQGTYVASNNVLEGVAQAIQSPKQGTYVDTPFEEEITLSTSGTTTDSSANLLPANSVIESVTARITTTILTATNWSVGDPTTAARFSSANSTLTAGTTSVGMNHLQGAVATDAAGPVQVAAAKVRITTTGTPSAGKIRVTIFARTFTAATS